MMMLEGVHIKSAKLRKRYRDVWAVIFKIYAEQQSNKRSRKTKITL